MKNKKENISPISIVFWQQHVSMHQVAFLESLIDMKINVHLVVDKIEDTNRTKMGWSSNHSRINIIVAPSESNVKKIILKPSFHILSGFSAGDCIKTAIKLLRSQGKTFYLLNEPPDVTEKQSIRNLIVFAKYRLFYFLNQINIKGVFAIGNGGIQFYTHIIGSKKIVPFGYFVRKSNLNSDTPRTNTVIQGIYIGRLLKYKGVDLLVENFLKVKNRIDLAIIGDGPLKRIITDRLGQGSAKKFLENSKAREEIAKKDVVFICNTSVEGWGTIVNESLLEGTYVVCTKHTGASIVIQNKYLGYVMDDTSESSFNSMFNFIEENVNMIRSHRNKRKEWSEKAINPESAAHYFWECLQYFESDRIDKPKPPWEVHAYL